MVVKQYRDFPDTVAASSNTLLSGIHASDLKERAWKISFCLYFTATAQNNQVVIPLYNSKQSKNNRYYQHLNTASGVISSSVSESFIVDRPTADINWYLQNPDVTFTIDKDNSYVIARRIG